MVPLALRHSVLGAEVNQLQRITIQPRMMKNILNEYNTIHHSDHCGSQEY